MHILYENSHMYVYSNSYLNVYANCREILIQIYLVLETCTVEGTCVIEAP